MKYLRYCQKSSGVDFSVALKSEGRLKVSSLWRRDSRTLQRRHNSYTCKCFNECRVVRNCCEKLVSLKCLISQENLCYMLSKSTSHLDKVKGRSEKANKI